MIYLILILLVLYDVKKCELRMSVAFLITLIILAVGFGVTNEFNSRLTTNEFEVINSQNISLETKDEQPILKKTNRTNPMKGTQDTYYCTKVQSSDNIDNLKEYNVNNTKVVFIDGLETPYIEEGYIKYKNKWLYLITFYQGIHSKLTNKYNYIIYVPSNTQVINS